MSRIPPHRPLAGARVLLTGLARRDRLLASNLAGAGAAVEHRPLIELRSMPDIEQPVRRALDDLPSSGWVILTSAGALEAVARAGLADLLRSPRRRVACVGAATAAAYEQLSGNPAELVGSGRGAAELAERIVRELPAATRLVWLRARRVAVDLRDRLGAERLESVVVYETVPSADADRIGRDVRAGAYDLVLFSSPSGVEALHEAAARDGVARADALGRCGAVAIGATTLRSLRVDRPAPCTIESSDGASPRQLLEATCRAWERLRKQRGTIRDRPESGTPEPTVGRETSELRHTPLHEAHERAGARLVEFAGWHMPVQYSGVIDEHLAVRRAAGLFDVSHMGEASVRGAGALEFLQYVTCNDVARLAPGRAHYTALTTPRGTFVDDLLVYMLGEADYLLVLNAANTPKDMAWLQDHAGAFDVELVDVSANWAQLAIQGPRASGIVEALRDGEPTRIRYYRFANESVAGVPCILSRTGYTGEDGFELYCAADDAAGLWARLLDAGAGHGLVPVGLAARDTLRLEAKMALYGNDIDDTTTVLEADLGWICKLDKGEFVGRDALLAQRERGIERKLVGFELRDRGIARHGSAAWLDGREVGRVTSGSHAPFLGKSIGLVYLPIEHCTPGTAFEVDVRGRRLSAEVVPTPFYTRAR